MTTGDTMRAHRQSKGISIRQLEREARVSRSEIDHYENGRREPSLSHLQRIYDALERRADKD